MTTFSMMSIPDKQLTVQAYNQLLLYYTTFHSVSTEHSKGLYKMKIARLKQLIDVLEKDLLKE